MSLRVRFAPSPTGRLHAGNARVALMNYLFAKKHGGEFMLRIDDTDTQRSKAEFTQAIIDDLNWLGIIPNLCEAQSQRTAKYDTARAHLIEAGRLYACYETAEELELKRKILLGQNRPPIYDREGLNLSDAKRAEYLVERRRPHWRFKLADTKIEWQDLAKGVQHFLPENLSDPVLIREDDTPLFTFTTVIDDIEFAISHIIRGDDHISNTAIQIHIFEALGAKILPEFAHLPLLANREGKNFSKRDDSISLHAIRETPIEPMALNAYLLRIGTNQAPDGKESFENLAKIFDLEAYGRASPRFDIPDLHDTNAKFLQNLDFDTVAARLQAIHPQAASASFWNMVKDNITLFSDIAIWAEICFGDFQAQQMLSDDADFIRAAAEILPENETLGADDYKAWLQHVAQATNRKGKPLFMPIRLALTGRNDGPEIGKIAEQIGKAQVKKRLMGTA